MNIPEKISDINILAHSIVTQTTNHTDPKPKKNAAAVALGRLGGLKGGKARAASLTAKKRQDIARKAALSRWK